MGPKCLATGLYLPHDVILLQYREDVIDEPVEYETRWEPEEKECEHDRHKLEHFRLDRIWRFRLHHLGQEHGDTHEDWKYEGDLTRVYWPFFHHRPAMHTIL